MWQNLFFSFFFPLTEKYQIGISYGLDLISFEIQIGHLFTCLSCFQMCFLLSLLFPSPRTGVYRCSFHAAGKPRWELAAALLTPLVVLPLGFLAWRGTQSCLLLPPFQSTSLVSALWVFSYSGFFVGFCLVWTSNVPWQHSLISDNRSFVLSEDSHSSLSPVLDCYSSPSFVLNVECADYSWETQPTLYKFKLCFSNQHCPECAWFAGVAERGCGCGKTGTGRGLLQASKHTN